MQSVKRTNYNSYTNSPVNLDPNTEKLQTIGMRIRKSIADGYMLPTSDINNNDLQQQQQHQNSYLTDYQQQHLSNIQRTPLPSHLQNTPPPLLYNGSTASSLAGWEDDINSHSRPLQTLATNGSFGESSTTQLKRRRDDDDDIKVESSSNYSNGNFQYCYQQPQQQQKMPSNNNTDLDQYVERYGPLSFKEEF